MARDPNLLIQPRFKNSKVEPITLDMIPDFDREDYDINDPKEFKYYIKCLENDIHRSIEYQRYINYLRENAGMNHCAFLPNVTNTETYKIKIEIHHEPLTLYDIVLAVFNKRSAMREDIDEFMVAKEVMYLHYTLQVGLIPLSETIHELVHNQYLFIPSNIVFGNYKKFVSMYRSFIEPETLETINKIEKMSENYNINDVRALLEPHIVHINDNTCVYDKEELMNFIKNNINRLNNVTSVT